MVERVMRTMGESVTRDQVLNLLRGLLQREFAEARVLVYLPVLLQRRACDCLRNAAAAPDADLQQRA
ncbi:hypothetical protein IP87_17430 [beta proteobacterium AAP121]|nr:hypothetical protein IP80_19535 [beta proteobacterium AAP65]KPF95176.1 hypothetical protein IP87_17430 [beta proteobacterium AAP121]